MTKYFYIGTKKQLKIDKRNKDYSNFMLYNTALKEYGSLKKIYKIHGKRYIHIVKLK